MDTSLLLTYISTYYLSLWLGFYLLGRDIRKKPLRLTGLGLGFYAAAIFLEVLQSISPPPYSEFFWNIPNVFIYLPALLWTGGLLSLLPDEVSFKARLFATWLWVVLPVTFLAVLAHGMFGFPSTILALVVTLPLTGAYLLLLIKRPRGADRHPLGLPLLATIFFGLAVGLALPFTWLPRWLVILSIGIDLFLLGVGIAIFDAFDEGQRLREDMLRSFMTTLFISLLFGIQIALAVNLDGSATYGTYVLLFSTISTTTAVATLGGLFRSVLASLTRPDRSPPEKDQLRAAADVIDKVNPTVDFTRMSPQEFQRLTRKAISYLGDLPRLAASPLTYLPIVTRRLEASGNRTDTLARANELKALLTERIQRLKPAGDEQFGATDAWRYYNALHFPYVVGLKPYRRSQPIETLSEHERQALDWFRVEVPERTLYNWQAAAAELVAQDLLEQINRETS